MNQQPVSTLSDEARARYIATVSQQSVFFHGSIYDNLTLAIKDQHQNCEMTEESIWQLLDKLALHDCIKALPEGLHTQMGEAARQFSGGETQRLSIARALLANTPVLILDEATAHLDGEMEQKILNAIAAYAPSQIQLVIHHRPLNSISGFHRHWLIEQGSLLETSHA
ncbi:ABC transporter ATP-binding protein (plasmid) [Photobacterium sp. GJ3]|uniref:ATP-binding cassette domain-containing protein n=1 Tax=Photobacterium sp. GJ3 TaxID=2829502 RepID=UPI001B8D986A|nr:ABC transporter ATP-binding protein [Photobacterium sp. GJ3]QUJ70157.1 ABC transporter ATP-binding protein [Photobacterium sp. GJ3]